MSHQVCQESDIVIFFQKILGESVPEGVGVDGIRINVVADGQVLQLDGNAAGGDYLAAMI